MTIPKRNLKTAQIEAIEWLQCYDEAFNQQKKLTDKELSPDPNHPAVKALRNFAYTGSFSNKNNQFSMINFLVFFLLFFCCNKNVNIFMTHHL
jgi:hypothetical protein